MSWCCMLTNTQCVPLCPWARHCDDTCMFLKQCETLSQARPVRQSAGSWMMDSTSRWWTAQKSGFLSENTNNQQLKLKLSCCWFFNVFTLSENCMVRLLSICDSDLQRWADSDDLIAIGSIDLQQHRNRLLQHRTTDVVETATRFVYSDVGDLAVSGGNWGFRDTSAIFNLYSHIINFIYRRDTSTGSPVGQFP